MKSYLLRECAGKGGREEGVAQVSHGWDTFPFGYGRLEQALERQPEGVMDGEEGREATHLARARQGWKGSRGEGQGDPRADHPGSGPGLAQEPARCYMVSSRSTEPQDLGSGPHPARLAALSL